MRLAALGAVAALAGCGGSSSASASARAAFVARANAICDQANARIVKLQAPAGSAELPSAARLLTQELPIASAELSALRSLKPPRAERTAFGEYLRNAASQLVAARRVREEAQANDPTGFREAVANLSALTPKSQQTAAAIGLAECLKMPEPHGGER